MVEINPAKIRERMQVYGRTSLSNSELLTLILGNDLSTAQVQEEYGQNLRPLSNVNLRHLTQIKSIGPASAGRLLAAIEFGYRLAKEKREPMPQIGSPTDAANLLTMEMRDLEQEHLVVLVLNTQNHVLAIRTIYIGNINSCDIRYAEVLRPAVALNAFAIIIAHNHPSGDPDPSPEDVEVTKKIIEAGELLDIEVLDHIIIGADSHVSLKDRGLI